METPKTTCWTVIQGAAQGHAEDREHFARRYGPVMRAYLEIRWGNTPLAEDVNDAVQEVFVECFKQGGVLEKIERVGLGSFGRFLHGVVRNVALRIEAKRARSREAQAPLNFDFDSIQRREATLSKTFDRAWARSLLDDAVANLLDLAEAKGESARKRVELLHLRFHEGLAIREIGQLWGAHPDVLHNDYQRARREFKAALLDVIEFHSPGSAEDIEKEFEEIIAILSD